MPSELSRFDSFVQLLDSLQYVIRSLAKALRAVTFIEKVPSLLLRTTISLRSWFRPSTEINTSGGPRASGETSRESACTHSASTIIGGFQSRSSDRPSHRPRSRPSRPLAGPFLINVGHDYDPHLRPMRASQACLTRPTSAPTLVADAVEHRDAGKP